MLFAFWKLLLSDKLSEKSLWLILSIHVENSFKRFEICYFSNENWEIFSSRYEKEKCPLLSFIGQKEFLFPKRISIKIFYFSLWCILWQLLLVLERKELADFQCFIINNGQTVNTSDIKETKVHTTYWIGHWYIFEYW